MNTTEHKANCYAGYTWRVFAHNKFAGYVVALSETNALRMAQEKFGKYIWIERIRG